MKKIAILALMLGLLAGCGTGRAASALPERMPADFEIRYENWVDGDGIKIYEKGEKELEKDLVSPDGQRTAQAELIVSDETKQEIYAKVRACALDRLGDEKLTSENLTTDGTQVGVAPLREYEITFTANGTTYTVTGDSTAQSYIRQDGRAAQFWEFMQYMNELYHNSPEYQSLPEAQGGYM